jgi:hypothetical protein
MTVLEHVLVGLELGPDRVVEEWRLRLLDVRAEIAEPGYDLMPFAREALDEARSFYEQKGHTVGVAHVEELRAELDVTLTE